MMISTYLVHLFVLAGCAQKITQAISGYPQLSSLSSQIASFPRLSAQLATADNFTFLAPTNDALATWLAKNQSLETIEAALLYHLLNGTYSYAALASKAVFIPTALTNTTYTNVTGGQRVVGYTDNGHMVFQSGGLRTQSKVITPVSVLTRRLCPRLTIITGHHSYWRPDPYD